MPAHQPVVQLDGPRQRPDANRRTVPKSPAAVPLGVPRVWHAGFQAIKPGRRSTP